MKKKIVTILLALTVLFVFGMAACSRGDEEEQTGTKEEHMQNKVIFTIGETELSATLVGNSATQALSEKLKAGPITVDMRDYGGWEKVGSFGFRLPASDTQITAQPCEFVLYQGDQLVIFYGTNSWSYTRLGKFDHVTQAELKEILGGGNVTVTIAAAME